MGIGEKNQGVVENKNREIDLGSVKVSEVDIYIISRFHDLNKECTDQFAGSLMAALHH